MNTRSNVIIQEKLGQLSEDGFCIFEQILTDKMVEKLNEMSLWTIQQEDQKHFDDHRSQGCIIHYIKFPHPTFKELITYKNSLNALASLGFTNPKVWSGFVISKPPFSPPLYWHQDGVIWEHPISYTQKPQQYFLMYYLDDTNDQNGCLRVIPKSHLKRHAIHDINRVAHEQDFVSNASDMNHPSFQITNDEMDVPVKAGDLIIGDARLLHSSHANQTKKRRTVITIWYWATYDQLPESVQALITGHIHENNNWVQWINDNDFSRHSLLPTYIGKTDPLKWNNIPGDNLL